MQVIKAIIYFIKKYRRLLTISTIMITTIIVLIVIGCFRAISPYSQYILTSEEQIKTHQAPVGLVLGAGVNKEGKPFRELQARLDVAAESLNKGYVSKLLLSGDNRFESYNEPDAMKNYLVNEKQIPETKLVVDYAGRSTYESCERANKIFAQDKLFIFSAESHLPRAIYLCRHFNIEAYGISSGVEANNSWRRELLARVKAVFNIKIIGEKTVLGDQISI